jgi:hypothetical protein
MVSLLALALALSAPVGATQTAAVASGPAGTQSSSVPVEQDLFRGTADEAEEPFDSIVVQPDSDICYKIRAYIFSKSSNPRLIRETTCGPTAPSARKIDGKPGFMPLDIKVKPDGTPDK